ncbi:MAG TPA: ribonuclease Z [Deltaproteobacteria bacterium]|nr:ribonuclease Z [Deltaproteobacteria bacterium]HPP79613.1 ribonuclease Z [Deltaproteobacteria bacterium]
MSERKLIVLGTASQVPNRVRNQNGYFLRFDDEGFLFDPGEGTQRQMLLAGIPASAVTKIFITHFHGDHCLGLAGVIQRISLDRVPHEVEVFYPASGQVFFERLQNACIYFPAARIHARAVCDEGVVHEDAKMTVRAFRLDHTVDTFGYRIDERDSFTLDPARLAQAGIAGAEAALLKSRGSLEKDGRVFKVEELGTLRRGQRFAFVMDTRVCEAAHGLAAGADLCVMEATYLSDMERAASEYGHLTASQAGRIAKASGVKRLVLTHYSQRYTDTDGFLREARALHDDVVVAVDLDVIDLARARRELG